MNPKTIVLEFADARHVMNMLCMERTKCELFSLNEEVNPQMREFYCNEVKRLDKIIEVFKKAL